MRNWHYLKDWDVNVCVPLKNGTTSFKAAYKKEFGPPLMSLPKGTKPDVPNIFVIRHPFARIYSTYKHSHSGHLADQRKTNRAAAGTFDEYVATGDMPTFWRTQAEMVEECDSGPLILMQMPEFEQWWNERAYNPFPHKNAYPQEIHMSEETLTLLHKRSIGDLKLYDDYLRRV